MDKEVRREAINKALEDTPAQISMTLFALAVAGRAYDAGHSVAAQEVREREKAIAAALRDLQGGTMSSFAILNQRLSTFIDRLREGEKG